MKKPCDSMTVMTELVLPNDTNFLGNLMGGRLMYWMDIAAGITAHKHSNRICVTASVDNLSFENPIKLGNTVHIQSKITRAFKTSMEIRLVVHGEDMVEQRIYKSNEAYYTFVALDQAGHPSEVSQLIPESDEEKELYQSALRRRQLRLILSGKMQPGDATELKELFKDE